MFKEFKFIDRSEGEKEVLSNAHIAACFEKQSELHPKKISVKSSKNELSYESLNHNANCIANKILQIEKRSEELNSTVAMLFEHDVDMIVGIIAILKTGKIYVPLDPTYPEERLSYILRDSKPRLILTNNNNLSLATEIVKRLKMGVEIININDIEKSIPGGDLNIKIDSKQMAYILYTSGSTGKPKGVIQDHRNIITFINDFIDHLKINASDRLMLLTSYSHTVAAIDIFSALLSGATLYLYDIKSENSLAKLSGWIKSWEITIFHSVPSIYRFWIEKVSDRKQVSTIRLIILGGEEVTTNDVQVYKKKFAKDCILVNLFGSSEVLIATSNLVDKKTEITRNLVPIGYPVDNVEIFLVDENDEEVGILSEGEFVFKSDYLSLGYWNLPEKTGEVFGIDPLPGDGKVYRSGDTGRVLPDGTIEYLGRKDFQVKILGNRVELSEIETVLDSFEKISKSIVAAFKKANGETFLVAYFVTKKKVDIDEEDLRKYLQQNLPDYMIPLFFVYLDKFPLTPNGKIDRRSLPEPEFEFKKGYVAPRNETEKKLIEIWTDMFHRSFKQPGFSLGIEDSFFKLGGNSLMAFSMMGIIHKEFNVKVTVGEIFKNSTISKLSEYIEKTIKDQFKTIEPSEKKEYYALSSAQKRFFILQNMEMNNTAFNLSQEVLLRGKIDLKKIEKAFKKLILRHESLRTSFMFLKGIFVQKIHEEIDFNVEYYKLDRNKKVVECKGLSDEISIKIGEKIGDFIRPFDLSKPPLIRVRLIQMFDGKHLLQVDMHHIISDKRSQSVLEKDFYLIYSGEECEILKLQYRDYLEWQNSNARQEILKQQESYWMNFFSENIPKLNLPTDYSRHYKQNYKGDEYIFELNKEITLKLKKIVLEKDITLFMIIIAIYNVFLSKLSGQEDIIVGVPVTGRGHDDLRDIIGIFVNIVAMRNFPRKNLTFTEFLEEVKKNSLKAFSNQDYQFEKIFEKLKFNRDLSQDPLFRTVINMPERRNINNSDALIADTKYKSSSSRLNTKISRYDITIYSLDLGDKIKFNCTYRTCLFKSSTIKYLMREFLRLIEEILKDRNRYLKEYKIFW